MFEFSFHFNFRIVDDGRSTLSGRMQWVSIACKYSSLALTYTFKGEIALSCVVENSIMNEIKIYCKLFRAVFCVCCHTFRAYWSLTVSVYSISKWVGKTSCLTSGDCHLYYWKCTTLKSKIMSIYIYALMQVFYTSKHLWLLNSRLNVSVNGPTLYCSWWKCFK